MLPGVYMVKFDMLNPNLTSKMAKNLNQSQTHEKPTFKKLKLKKTLLRVL